MGSTGRRFSVRAGEPTWVQDWVDAELVERVEVVEARVVSLDLERDLLEAELAEHVEAIEARVELLDAERTELETAFGERIALIEALVESLDHERERLETEFSVAQSWGPHTAPSPPLQRQQDVKQEEEPGPLVPRDAAPPQHLSLALPALLVLAPWAFVAAVGFAVSLLL